jgi:hypothetical protein
VLVLHRDGRLRDAQARPPRGVVLGEQRRGLAQQPQTPNRLGGVQDGNVILRLAVVRAGRRARVPSGGSRRSGVDGRRAFAGADVAARDRRARASVRVLLRAEQGASRRLLLLAFLRVLAHAPDRGQLRLGLALARDLRGEQVHRADQPSARPRRAPHSARTDEWRGRGHDSFGSRGSRRRDSKFAPRLKFLG